MGKYRMYEPYGYDDNTNYVSKKDQIEGELEMNRINDRKEFASVEYDEEKQAFVFKNVKGQERGYAYMADIVPQELITDVYYNTETEKLIITFSNGKTVEIPLNDLIDVVDAGDGLKNVDGKFYINLADSCEGFLTVDENGLLLSGVQDAIDTERDRATSAETSLRQDLNAETNARTENDRQIRGVIGTGFSTNETETITYKFNDLNDKLTTEANARYAADEGIRTELLLELSGETVARTTKDTELDNKITALSGSLKTMAYESKTDYYEKSETSGATELQAAFEDVSDSFTEINAQTETISSALNYLNDKIKELENRIQTLENN